MHDLFSNYFAYSDFRAGSIGNLTGANMVSPQPEQDLEEQVEENNDDVVSFGKLRCALLLYPFLVLYKLIIAFEIDERYLRELQVQLAMMTW
jgi:hypothetical protein